MRILLLRRMLRIWSHLLKKSLMENFIFCALQPENLIEKPDPIHAADLFLFPLKTLEKSKVF